jgi:hypothetical protein
VGDDCAGDPTARRELFMLLREQGNLDEAVAVWRCFSDYSRFPVSRSIMFFDEHVSFGELRRIADAGHEGAAREVARWRRGRATRPGRFERR